MRIHIMLNRQKIEEKKAYQKAYYEAHKEERKAYREAHKEEKKAYDKAHREEKKAYDKAHGKAYYEAHKEEKLAYQKAYREAHKEEKKAYQKAYRERKKREGQEGSIHTNQKRQRKNPKNNASIFGNNQLNFSTPLTEEIRLRMVDSVLEALDQNLPNPSISGLIQGSINTETFNNGTVSTISNLERSNPESNNFYRNSSISYQLLFGNKGQVQNVCYTEELGRAKLPSQKERDDDFVDSLLNF